MTTTRGRGTLVNETLADEIRALPGILGAALLDAAHARREAAQARLDLGELEAEAELRARRRPPEGEGRVTEGLVQALVATDEAVRQQRRTCIDAESEQRRAEVAVLVAQARLSACRMLVALETATDEETRR